MSNDAMFGQYLKLGVQCIVAHSHTLQQKSNQEEVLQTLGARVGRTSHTVAHWMRGHVPPTLNDIETLADACVTEGRMNQNWLRGFLTAANHPQVERVVTRFFPEPRSLHLEFIDSDLPTIEIADLYQRVSRYVREAKHSVWVLNSHTQEPDLLTLRYHIQNGSLTNRLAAARAIISQYDYYNVLISRVSRAPEEPFEYIRLVQLEDGTISSTNTGYHYLRHFYRMASEAEQLGKESTFMPSARAKIELLQGPPIRDITFVLIDRYRLILQLSGVHDIGIFDLRGVLIVEDTDPDGIPSQWAKMFHRLKRPPMQAVPKWQIEQFNEATSPLGDLIANELSDLFVALVTDPNDLHYESIQSLLELIRNEEDVRSALPIIHATLHRDSTVKHCWEQRCLLYLSSEWQMWWGQVSG